MIKDYTNIEYFEACQRANAENKTVYILTYDVTVKADKETEEIIHLDEPETHAKIELAPCGYYICQKDNITDGMVNPDYEQSTIDKLKSQKNAENIRKAKAAIENGYVIFKNAEFETNAQTVGDLTATMLLMQASGMETYHWLSKDDKEVKLTIDDFGTLGGLIASYKALVWNTKYLYFKTQIEGAETIEQIERIVIDYDENPDD